MSYITETKVYAPDQHVLGILDGDNQCIYCRECKIVMASTNKVGLTTYVIRYDKLLEDTEDDE